MIKLLNINLSSRVVGLDVMRSIAILLVVFGHFSYFFYEHLHVVIPKTSLSVNRVLGYFINGFDGVDLFFVLSGFLIGHSLLNAHGQKRLNFSYLVKNFWIKRWLRTLPNYIVVLIFTIILFYLIPPIEHNTNESIFFYRYFVFCQNIFHGELVFFPESWSLAVEEWFYILFPIILAASALAFAKGNFQKQVLFLIIVIYIVIGTLIRINYVQTHSIENTSSWNRDIRTAVFMRFDAIIYGVFMAFMKIYFPEKFKKYRYLTLFLGALILLLAFKFAFLNEDTLQGYNFFYGTYFSFVGIGMALLLPYFFHLNLKNKLMLQIFTSVSVLSYSIYLVNYTLVQKTIENLWENKSLSSCVIKSLLSVFLCLIISIILYKYIETPFMNLRKKILNE